MVLFYFASRLFEFYSHPIISFLSFPVFACLDTGVTDSQRYQQHLFAGGQRKQHLLLARPKGKCQKLDIRMTTFRVDLFFPDINNFL
jgi:hypothetical protein